MGGVRELSQNGNKCFSILLSNELDYGIVENNVCSKLEENRAKISTLYRSQFLTEFHKICLILVGFRSCQQSFFISSCPQLPKILLQDITHLPRPSLSTEESELSILSLLYKYINCQNRLFIYGFQNSQTVEIFVVSMLGTYKVK